MFNKTGNNCFVSDPFIYKINPSLYKILTHQLIENRNFLTGLKKNLLNKKDYNEQVIYKSLPGEIKNYLGINRLISEKDITGKLFHLIQYEQFFKELGAGLKFSPLSIKKSNKQFLRNTLILLEKFDDLIKPKLVFKKVNVVFKSSGIELTEYGMFLPGKKPVSYFYPALSKDVQSEMILYIAAIGDEIDNLIKKFLEEDEVLDAYTLNAIGGAAAEMTAYDFNLYANENLNSFKNKKFKRFSPGYGDLSLNVQKILFDILKPENLIGVKLYEGNIIIPEKSTSGIMGLVKS
jgi:hypothetical protein